jgi:RNA polymerase sigma factor (sigma-70 family)
VTPALSSTLLRTQTDERLVRLAGDGHDRAFEAIVERYRRPLARYLRRMLPAPRAEDALQQTFVNAWAALSAGTEVRELRGWLYRIAHNTAAAGLQRAGYDYDELHESLQGAGAVAEDAERRNVIRETLASVARLPERQREALLAIAVQGRPHAEVAAELGLTDGALRQLVHRARCTLRAGMTAVTPMPLVHWLLGAPAAHEETTRRVAELVTTAGAGGVAAAIKVGAVAVTAAALVAPRIAHVVAPASHHPSHDHAPPVRLVAAVHDRAAGNGATARGGSPAHRATILAPAGATVQRSVVLHHHAWHRAHHHGHRRSTAATDPPPQAAVPAPTLPAGPPPTHHDDPGRTPAPPSHSGAASDSHGSPTPGTLDPTTASPPQGGGDHPSTMSSPSPDGSDAPPAPPSAPVPTTTTTTTAAAPPLPPCHEVSCAAEQHAPPTTTTTTSTPPPPPPVVCYDNCPPGVTPTPRPPGHDTPTTPTTPATPPK